VLGDVNPGGRLRDPARRPGPRPIGQRLRPSVCENGTYLITSGIFSTTERASAVALRPLPYPPAFGNAFPEILTFVGTPDRS
jgi:hypothetical protein